MTRAFAFVCILHLALCVAGVAGAEIIDRVLAVVGGVVITQSDVAALSGLGLVEVGQVADATGVVLSQLIDRQLILMEVDRYAPPEPASAAVDSEAALVRARFPSATAYQAALARVGIDEKRLHQTLRDELRIRAYLEQRFTVPPPNDEELNRYYREHLGAFTRGTEVVSFTNARTEIVRRIMTDRRASLIDDWVSGLRRRAVITNLYLPRQ